MADEVLEYRVNALESSVNEIKDAVKGIDRSLNSLCLLEERHIETKQALERAFGKLEKQDGRIQEIESNMPSLKEVRDLIKKGILGILAIVGVGIVGLILK